MENKKIVKKSRRGLKIFGIIVAILLISYLIIWIIPGKKVVESNPFIAKKGTLFSAAHQGGENVNPSNTMKAFKAAVEVYDVDILELDLHMTKDSKIVVSHDESINRLSNVADVTGSTDKYYIYDHNYDELLQFNFGARFKDKQGDYPYKDADMTDPANYDLRIPLLTELLDYIKNNGHSHIMFIMEIKTDKVAGNTRELDAMDKVYGILDDYNLLNKTTIGSFEDEVHKHIEVEYPDIYRGFGVMDVAFFKITQIAGLNSLYINCKSSVMQIPISEEKFGITFHLDRANLIKRAHKRNVAVQYWTINDPDEMERLIKLGADCIMTDEPGILNDVMAKLGIKKAHEA